MPRTAGRPALMRAPGSWLVVARKIAYVGGVPVQWPVLIGCRGWDGSIDGVLSKVGNDCGLAARVWAGADELDELLAGAVKIGVRRHRRWSQFVSAPAHPAPARGAAPRRPRPPSGFPVSWSVPDLVGEAFLHLRAAGERPPPGACWATMFPMNVGRVGASMERAASWCRREYTSMSFTSTIWL